MPAPKGNVPPGARWTVAKAVSEFAVFRETIRAGLTRDAVKPGDDGCYTTKEIIGAIYGDMRGEQLRRLRKTRTTSRSKTKCCAPKLIPADEAHLAVEGVLTAIERVLLDLPFYFRVLIAAMYDRAGRFKLIVLR